MSANTIKGVIYNGQVKVEGPINLPEGSQVTIIGHTTLPDHDGLMTRDEIARTLAAMARVEPFDMTDEERAAAEAWEKQVNDYTIANMNKGVEDLFP